MLRQELFLAYNANISLEQQRMVIHVHIAVVAIFEKDKEEQK